MEQWLLNEWVPSNWSNSEEIWCSLTVPNEDQPIDLDLDDLIWEPDKLQEGTEPNYPIDEDQVDPDDKSTFEKPIHDYLSHAEILLPKGG